RPRPMPSHHGGLGFNSVCSAAACEPGSDTRNTARQEFSFTSSPSPRCFLSTRSDFGTSSSSAACRASSTVGLPGGRRADLSASSPPGTRQVSPRPGVTFRDRDSRGWQGLPAFYGSMCALVREESHHSSTPRWSISCSCDLFPVYLGEATDNLTPRL